MVDRTMDLTVALIRASLESEANILKIRERVDIVHGIKQLSVQDLEGFMGATAQIAKRIYSQAVHDNIKILPIFSAEYPDLLKQIYDWPFILYLRGQIPRCPRIAIVGARDASRYGIGVARELAYHLTQLGVCIVSGLAHGIDRAAHEGALEAARESGNSAGVAVLGSGLCAVYPASHRGLAQSLLDTGGGLLSEYPPQWRARKHYFLQRNRLISGLSNGTVIVEAKSRSGALATVRHALEQGRDVFAVPGEITSALSEGTNQLLKQGANTLLSARDIVEFLGEQGFSFVERDKQRESIAGSGCPQASGATLELLRGSSLSFDELLKLLTIPAEQLLISLAQLELAGLVRTLPDGRFHLLKYE